MFRARRLSTVGFGVVVLAGCAAESALQSDSDPSTTADGISQAVIGGTPALPCQWPSTVRIEGGCTGTLIHPRVVTTAAHCLQSASMGVSFGEVGAPGTFSVKGRCVAGARGEDGTNSSKDWAYCVLPEDARIAAIPVTAPLVGCEAKLVGPGSSAWVVGYGATSPRGNLTSKRQVEVKINAFDKVAPGTIDVGDRNVGACHGDSGGPLYVHLRKDGHDYGVRVAGSTSGAGPAFYCDCTCSTTYVNIENHVRAIEKNEGIDVTPCTDADGNWDPGPLCRELARAPEDGTGSYPAACIVDKTVEPIESCGSNSQGTGGAADGGAPDAATAADAGRVAVRDASIPDAASPSSDPEDAGGAEPTPAIADAGRSRPDASTSVKPARDAGKRDASRAEGEEDSSDESSGHPYAEADSGCATAGAHAGHPGNLLGMCLGGLALGLRRKRRLHGAARRALEQ